MATVKDYYEIVAIKDNVIHSELKGAWSDRVMEQFSEEIQTIYSKAVLSLKGRKFILIADWSGALVIGPKAESHLTRSMVIFKQNNGYKVIEVVPKTLVRIGLKKAASQTREDNFRIVVNTLAEAWKLVPKLQEEIRAFEATSAAEAY